MFRIFTSALCLGLLFLTKLPSEPVKNGSQTTSLVIGTQQFAFDFYKQMQKQHGNLFFSPYNIATAFAMTAAGARGQTEKEMLNALHLSHESFAAIAILDKQLSTALKPQSSFATLLLANGLWVQNDFKLLPSFRRIIEDSFRASIENVDFEKNSKNAVETINKWVSTNTKNKINNLLTTSDVTADTRLVLTSAIYLKAQWHHLFNEHETQKMPFHTSQTSSVDVDMMNTTSRYPIYEDNMLSVIEIPYVTENSGPQLVMIIALPKAVDGLSQFEQTVSLDKFHTWIEKASMRRVKLALPKFKIETRIDLNNVMEALGIKQAFTQKADFSGISGHPNLFISKAVHQTFIDVNEKGTEAAAATAISMNLTAMLPEESPYIFVADHPFMFFIMDKASQTILFMGRIAEL